MRTPKFLQSPKGILISGIFGFVVLVALILLLLTVAFGNSNETQENSTTQLSTTTSEGVGGSGIQSDIRQIIDSVASTRNLSGLTLRINQVDVCELPELTAYIAVSSDSGDVSQLNNRDVKVYVDDKEVVNPEFAPVDASEQPLSATLVIDRSGSMAGEPINQAKAAASQFVDRAGDNDRIGVVQFGASVETLLSLSKDKNAAKQAINQITAVGDTALYDALNQGVAATSGCSRRAVVILSDGGDTSSKNASLDSAINAANVAGIPAFVVGLQGSTYDSQMLRGIAERTGGQLFETTNPAELAELYAKVDAQLKGQYYVGLKLDIPKTGGEHRLKIVSNIEGSPTTSERSFIY